MWAGVQNESRPMVRCQEMSHIPPTMTLVDANATARSGHVAREVADAASRATTGAAVEGAAEATDDMHPAYRYCSPNAKCRATFLLPRGVFWLPP